MGQSWTKESNEEMQDRSSSQPLPENEERAEVSETQEADDSDDEVPTVFRWEHGGRQVYVTGTFNNWQRQIPMHRSGNDFTYIHNLYSPASPSFCAALVCCPPQEKDQARL